LRGACRFHEAVKIADVPSCLFDDLGVVFVFGPLMRGHNCARFERLDLIECSDPFLSRLLIRLGKIKVDVVVGGVAGFSENRPWRVLPMITEIIILSFCFVTIELLLSADKAD
jgi:hypothetical protein